MKHSELLYALMKAYNEETSSLDLVKLIDYLPIAGKKMLLNVLIEEVQHGINA